uniref:HECT domain-containing protein n=1 Tax=Poecilia formosa TaxID=48698 RepID=A0A096M4T5_POEFO
TPLLRFLRNRGVPEECLSRMEEEHIDATVIDCMDDGTLSEYIPTYGDRIAARRFWRKMGLESSDENLDQADTSTTTRTRTNAQSNKCALKKTRRIDLGWIHDGKQVRTRKGGGTRTIDVPKDTKKSDLINYSKELFFPNGKCRFGSLETLNYDILDFQEEAVLDESITVGELYSLVRLGRLRFYFSTTSKINLQGEESEGNDVQTIDLDENDQESEPLFNLSSDLDESEVTFGPVSNAEPIPGELDDTIIYQFEGDEQDFISLEIPNTNTSGNRLSPASNDEGSTSAASNEIVCITIKLHRSNLLEEMITQFKDKILLRQTLKFCFIDEKGADADGVSRDVYTTFWTEFMEHIGEGEEVRVPSLPNRWQKQEWKSIGRILLKGFKDHGYFPCRLAPAFTVALIFGESEVSEEMLFESLLLYITQSDRDLVSNVLKSGCPDEDRDELVDLLDRLNVTALPTQDNLKGLLLSAAHKHLIQKPRYAAEQMSSTASHILKESFCSPQALLQMYQEKKPTTKRFLKLLEASPTTQAESQSFRFLQQYIRGLDDPGLRRMLRFVTGSDMICVNKVEVIFTPLEGLARRPIAHTCGPALELPWTYGSYPELCCEMDSILLNQNSFEFSIV